MADREEYRNSLKNKLLGLEDEGYGDFEYQDSELNDFLAFAIARLYPAVYKTYAIEDETVESYGTQGWGEVETELAQQVYLVEDATEGYTVTGWQVRPGKIRNIDTGQFTSVNLYYHDAVLCPDDDSTDVGVSAVYKPLIVLGALIEALEARHDTGVRGDPPPTGQHYETQLLDRLTPRYDRLREELSMGLPGIQV